MPSKYDTNPLDPEFPEKARAAAAGEEQETVTLPYRGGPTRRFPEASPTEEQTRRFADPDVAGYSAPYSPPYSGQYVPATFAHAGMADMNSASNRKVGKVGIAEKWLVGLPYLPFSIGLVAGLILLLVIPKEESKVRFHAAQGLAAHVGILIVTTILSIVSNVADIAELGSFIFTLVTTIMLFVFAIKAWKGKPVHIATLDDLTNWLDEKIRIKS